MPVLASCSNVSCRPKLGMALAALIGALVIWWVTSDWLDGDSGHLSVGALESQPPTHADTAGVVVPRPAPARLSAAHRRGYLTEVVSQSGSNARSSASPSAGAIEGNQRALQHTLLVERLMATGVFGESSTENRADVDRRIDFSYLFDSVEDYNRENRTENLAMAILEASTLFYKAHAKLATAGHLPETWRGQSIPILDWVARKREEKLVDENLIRNVEAEAKAWAVHR